MTCGAVWLALLDEAVAEIGRRGIHHLIAETDESGPELADNTVLEADRTAIAHLTCWGLTNLAPLGRL